MNIFNIATKSASILALSSVAIEAHDIAKKNSKRGFAQASADKFVKDSIGASKLNYESSKFSEIKDFIANNDTIDHIKEVKGGVGGYISGFVDIAKKNMFTLGFGTLGLIAKTQLGKVIALAGMGISIIFDTVNNATSLFERTDYLDN